jgi:hypothetical protein
MALSAGSDPLLRGPFAAHPEAARFAAEVRRVHRRYAAEVVAANRLCPFLRDVDTGFGAFVVVLDPGEPDVDAAVAALAAADSPVVHLVFPLASAPPARFERFSGRLAQALKATVSPAPVMATFHPSLGGDVDDPHRLVGLLRRAPDPFVQLIPEGLHEGGTVFAGVQPGRDNAEANFDRLRGGGIEPILALLADIRADRDRSYAPFLSAFDIARSASSGIT